jgi:hypothetical protein
MFIKKGKVVDETGMGIPGVHISVVGSSWIGTETDIDGNYSLQVSSTTKLNFSHLGRGLKTITASNVPEVLRLDSSSETLDEVVLEIPPKGGKKSYLGLKIVAGIAGAFLLLGLASSKEKKEVKKVVL